MRRDAGQNTVAAVYALATLASTFAVGQILLWAFPKGETVGASVLFILMNLLPLLMAFIFSRAGREVVGPIDFLKKVFLQRESATAYAAALGVAILYYGLSALLGNVQATGAPAAAVLLYFPWTILQGGLEEVGWRWYLQPKLTFRNSFALKMLLISVVWFLWHIPIYRLPWITAGSRNYGIFYLMILGNTFALGAVKELSKGALPCIVAHMLVDALAAAMLVQGKTLAILCLVLAEIILSVAVVKMRQRQNRVE